MPLSEHIHEIQRPEASSGFQTPLSSEQISKLSLKGINWRKSGICVLYPCSGVEITNGKISKIVSRESLREKI